MQSQANVPGVLNSDRCAIFKGLKETVENDVWSAVTTVYAKCKYPGLLDSKLIMHM